MSALGSIAASESYLAELPWWPAFRHGRRDVALIDDVLLTGHFCRYLQGRGVTPERCTLRELEMFFASVGQFRPGPRSAAERTAVDLIAFLQSRAD
jgi:hypothetical protein